MGYSGSTSGGITKHEYAIRLAASLAYLLIGQQDAVGMGLIDKDLNSYIPPRGRPSHLQALIAAMASSKCTEETKLADVLQKVAPRVRGRGIVVLISDCFDNVESLVNALIFYRLGRSEVVVFQICDRDELEFPFRQRTEFRNMEMHSHRKMIDPNALRRAYLEKVAAFKSRA